MEILPDISGQQPRFPQRDRSSTFRASFFSFSNAWYLENDINGSLNRLILYRGISIRQRRRPRPKIPKVPKDPPSTRIPLSRPSSVSSPIVKMRDSESKNRRSRVNSEESHQNDALHPSKRPKRARYASKAWLVLPQNKSSPLA